MGFYDLQVRALIAAGVDRWHPLKEIGERMVRMHWAKMELAPRTPATAIVRSIVPTDPGVYAWYREGKCVYVGKAVCLRDRVCGNHRGRHITSSAFQRNVAELLGIASSADIKARRYVLTDPEATRVREWLDACEVAWLTCATDADAKKLEADLKGEWCPPLTKR